MRMANPLSTFRIDVCMDLVLVCELKSPFKNTEILFAIFMEA